MRKAKLYQLLAVAGGLSVAVASTPAWAKPVANVDVVTPLNWTAGTATVDGDVSDWGDLSGGNIMCTAGSLGVDGCEGNGKEQLSTVYLRYDCSTSTMYVLVLEADGKDAERSESDAWVTVGGNSNKVLENFAWVGNTDGYEASFTMTEDSDNVQVHLNVSGNTSSTGKNGDTSSITGLDSCEMPVVEDPVDEPTDPVDEPTDPVDEPTDPVDEPTDPVDEPTDPVDEPTDPVDEPTDPVDEPTDPVDEPTSGGGNPNMACSEIMGDNGAPMKLIEKFNWGGSYESESNKGAIDIGGDETGGSWSIKAGSSFDGIIDVDAVILKGATETYVYNYEHYENGPGAKTSDGFSKSVLPLNNGGQVPDISNIQFCEDGELQAGQQVCLWTGKALGNGEYKDVVRVDCAPAEKGISYAIEVDGEFSSALEAE